MSLDVSKSLKAAVHTREGREQLMHALTFWAGTFAAAWLIMSGGVFVLFGLLTGWVTYRYVWRKHLPVSFALAFVAIVGNLLPTMALAALWKSYADHPSAATSLGALGMTLLIIPTEIYFNVGYALRDEPSRNWDQPR